MKKLTVILTFCLALLVSCTSTTPITYNVMLRTLTDGQIFKKNSPISDNLEPTDEEIVFQNDVAIKLGNKTLTANLTKKIKYKSGDRMIYTSSDGNTEYHIYEGQKCFSIISNNGTKLHTFLEDGLSEHTLISFIKACLCEYVGDIELSNFVYTCSTYITTYGENATWQDTHEGFCLSSSEKEQVSGYLIELIKYHDDIATSDKIRISCDENGNIRSILYLDTNTAWTEATFDEATVNNSIKNFLNENMSENCKLRSYEIKSTTLSVNNGKFALSVSIEIDVQYNGENIVILQPLIVELE